MKTLKNITYTLVTLSLITFLAATNSFAEPNFVKGEKGSVTHACLTDSNPHGVDEIYLNGKN